MNIFLTDQSNKFPTHLERLRKTPVIKYDIANLRERKTETEIRTARDFENIDFGFLFGYHIFPGNIMNSLTQWGYEQRALRTGDTIVQQVFIPPVSSVSQKIIFGVRIKEVSDEPNRKGYSYETLEGHVEKGISSFFIEKNSDGKVIFTVHTFSVPANFLTKLLGPVFSVPYQAYCTKRAIKNVRALIESQK